MILAPVSASKTFRGASTHWRQVQGRQNLPPISLPWQSLCKVLIYPTGPGYVPWVRLARLIQKNPEEATRHFKVDLYVKFVQVKPRRALEAESKTRAVGLTSSCPWSPAGNSWLRAA